MNDYYEYTVEDHIECCDYYYKHCLDPQIISNFTEIDLGLIKYYIRNFKEVEKLCQPSDNHPNPHPGFDYDRDEAEIIYKFKWKKIEPTQVTNETNISLDKIYYYYEQFPEIYESYAKGWDKYPDIKDPRYWSGVKYLTIRE
jgi:hypothetical protein